MSVSKAHVDPLDEWRQLGPESYTVRYPVDKVRILLDVYDEETVGAEEIGIALDDVSVTATKEDLTVRVMNVEGKPLPSPGGNIRVKLWDVNGNLLVETSKPYEVGAPWVDFDMGKFFHGKYYLEVYRDSWETLEGMEFWGVVR